MDRQYYLDLAASGLRMPIGADLILREQAAHEAIVLDGRRLGAVVAQAARAYGTPLAIPLMDLTIEKAQMLSILGVPEAERDTYHFSGSPTDAQLEAIVAGASAPLTARLSANIEAVRFIAHETDLVPCAMAIGPFSLMVKLLADPITPVYAAGAGASPDDDDEVRAVHRALEMATRTTIRSIEAQISAGAALCVIAEPAANLVYLSPKQLQKGSDVFERLVMQYNRRVREVLTARGVDLFFHCCGELTPQMVEGFASLDPAILSLGSSRKLWDDAALVPKTTVLFGNLPTKRFYADDLTIADVKRLAEETVSRMRAVGHPHILGSECDVLSVPGKHSEIREKVQAFLTA